MFGMNRDSAATTGAAASSAGADDEAPDEDGALGGGGGASKKKKRARQKDAKKSRAEPHAPARDRIPAPELPDWLRAERIQYAQREYFKRQRIGPDKLPSICMYSLVNSKEG